MFGYARLIGLGLILFALGVQTWRIASLKQDHAEYVASVERDKANAAEHALSVEREQSRISEQKDELHAQAISDLRAVATQRLQALTGRAEPLPPVPAAAFQPDAAAGSDRLCIKTPFAVSLMLSADENTKTLTDLQDWVREQQRVEP